MTIFIFADILVVCKNAGFREAFETSARLVRPFFWKVFRYLIAVVSISLVPEIIYQVGQPLYPSVASSLHKISAVIIMPFLMIAQVELFHQIESRLGFEPRSSEENTGFMSNDDE